MFNLLRENQWEIFSNAYAEQILFENHPNFCSEFENILSNHWITEEELIAGGGGMHVQTQRLGGEFDRVNLKKTNLISRHQTIDSHTDNIIYESATDASHEIDHMYLSESGNIAIEIEWNTKPISFDRDLDAFRRFYMDMAIDVGIIITRGESLNKYLPKIIDKFFESRIGENYLIDAQIIEKELADKDMKYTKPTKPQRNRIDKMTGQGFSPSKALSKVFHTDKYGSSTTHWETLMQRFNRGGYRHVPLLFIGIPKSSIKF